MGLIGGGIFLFVIGAIITYALEVDIPGMDASTLGMILMVAGGLMFVIGLIMAIVRRSRTAVTRAPRDDVR